MGTMLFGRGAEGYDHHCVGSQYFLSLNPTKVFKQYALCLGTACALDREDERKDYDQSKNGKHQLMIHNAANANYVPVVKCLSGTCQQHEHKWEEYLAAVFEGVDVSDVKYWLRAAPPKSGKSDTKSAKAFWISFRDSK